MSIEISHQKNTNLRSMFAQPNMMKKMKICFWAVGLSFLTGGHKYVHNLSKKLIEDGHEVTVATRSINLPGWTKEGVNYEAIMVEKTEPPSTSIRMPLMYLIFSLKSLLYFFRHREFDVIHCMAGHPALAILASLIRLASRKPVIREIASPVGPYLRFLRFDSIMCTSRHIQSEFGERGTFITRLVDLERFKTSQQYNYRQDNSFVVGALGTADRRRGFDVLIKAIPVILDRYPNTIFTLAIPTNQAEIVADERRGLDKLNKLIDELGISGNTRIVGEVDVPTFLNSIDVLVAPIQTTELMADPPTAILECLASGCALVTSPIGGIPEVVHNYENGIMVGKKHYNDPQAYAQKIIELMENRDLLEKIKNNARKSIEDYDIDRVYPQILNLYNEVSQRGRNG